MTTSEDSTIQELHVDEMAARKTCKNCGAVLKADHGIVRMTEGTGVSWWRCPNTPDCGKRFKEDYKLDWKTDNKTTLSIVEV
jgi:predicted RNA-binding Zn-ribbon protein involved in translation (DUF1610 family)